MSKVIVVLDRDEARADVERLGILPSVLKGEPLPTLDALRAALQRDPDELVEQVAEAIYGLARSAWNQGKLNYATGPKWERLTDWQRKGYLDMARAAIAALTGKGKA